MPVINSINAFPFLLHSINNQWKQTNKQTNIRWFPPKQNVTSLHQTSQLLSVCRTRTDTLQYFLHRRSRCRVFPVRTAPSAEKTHDARGKLTRHFIAKRKYFTFYATGIKRQAKALGSSTTYYSVGDAMKALADVAGSRVVLSIQRIGKSRPRAAGGDAIDLDPANGDTRLSNFVY